MSASVCRCPMCGHRFDPAAQRACRSCPLHRHCALACCPACGYASVDLAQSRLVQWWSSFTAWARQAQRRPLLSIARTPRTLVQVAPATWARVVGFAAPAIEQQTQLQAYGLIAGRTVRVVQHAPVTVVQIDQTELALEGELAGGILVEALD